MQSEKEVKRCFDLHNDIFEKIPLSMIIMDSKATQIIYINDECTKILGLSKTEAMEKNLFDMNVFPKRQLKAFIDKIIAYGECKHEEFKFFNQTGAYQHGFISGSVIEVMNGHYIMITYDDMTGKLLESKSFSPTEKRLINILNNQACMIWMKDLEGRYLLVNKPFLDFSHYQLHEVINKTDAELWSMPTVGSLKHFDDYTKSMKSYEKIIETVKTSEGEKKLLIINSPLVNDMGAVEGTVGFAFTLNDYSQADSYIYNTQYSFINRLFENSQQAGNVGSWHYNAQSREIWLSPESYRILNIPAGTPVNFNLLLSYVFPEDQGCIKKAFAVENSPKPIDCEFRIENGGKNHWLHLRGILGRNENISEFYATGTIHDITERRQIDEVLRQSREKLLSIEKMFLKSQKAGNVGSWVIDIRNNHIWGTEEAYRIFGIEERKDLTPESLMAYICGRDRKKVLDSWKKCICTDTFDAEFRIRRNGDIRWLHCKAEMEKNKKGVPQRVIGTILDITERKKMEIKLQKSEEKFRTIADWTYACECWISPGGKILYISPSCERISGYAKENFLKNSNFFYKIIHPQDVENVRTEYENMNFRDKVGHFLMDAHTMEYRIYTKHNELRWIQQISRGVYASDGKYLGLRISNRDITFVKQAEEINRELVKAKEIETLRNEFFANISHELRMPLTIIFSSLQLVQPALFDDAPFTKEIETIRKHYHYIIKNCYRLMKLVNNLIDITKIDAGYVQLLVQNCDIVDIVRQIVASVDLFIKEKGINMVFQTEVRELWVNCDPDKIERIFLNLLSNAAKFNSPGGSIAVRFKVKSDRFCIEVEDTGEGIEPNKQNTIFERFRQADNSFTRRHEGSGTGLSIVKMLLDLMGGSIRIRSDAGAGSVFIVEIPMELKKNGYSLNNFNGMKWYPKEFSVNVEFSDIYS